MIGATRETMGASTRMTIKFGELLAFILDPSEVGIPQ
jgi:hypothetical protein